MTEICYSTVMTVQTMYYQPHELISIKRDRQ